MNEKEAAGGGQPHNEPSAVRSVRTINNAVGTAEQALLVLFMALLIGVAVLQVAANKFFDKGWPATFELIRNSVFFVAMTSAALCAQADKMIAMDFITRVVKPKTRAYLRVSTRVFTIVICIFLVIGGWIVREGVAAEDYELMKPATVLLALPVGAGLIALHTLLYLIIDVIYISRGEPTPELENAGSFDMDAES